MSAGTSRNKPKARQFDIDSVYPVGRFYVQFPGAYNTDGKSNDLDTAFPVASTPAALFGGVWEEQFTDEGIFFRTRGSSAQDDNRSNGSQPYAIKNITGSTPGISTCDGGAGSGAFLAANQGAGWWWASVNGQNASISFDASRVVNTSTLETRPTNRLMKIWKRTS